MMFLIAAIILRQALEKLNPEKRTMKKRWNFAVPGLCPNNHKETAQT